MNWFLSWSILVNIWLVHWIMTATVWWWFLGIIIIFTVLMGKNIFLGLKWYKLGLGIVVTILITTNAIVENKNYTKPVQLEKTVTKQTMEVKAKYTKFYIVGDQKQTNYYLSAFYYQGGQRQTLNLEIDDQIEFCYENKTTINHQQQRWLWMHFRTKKQIFVSNKCLPVIKKGETWYRKIHAFLIKQHSKSNQNWIRFLLFQQTTPTFSNTKSIMLQMGIVHLFVISGFHLLVLIKIWFALARRTRSKIFKTSVEIVGLGVAVFLVYLTNWKFSATKALLFILLNWWSAKVQLGNKNRKEQIAVVILVFLSFNPLLFYRVDFQLSCLASWILLTNSVGTNSATIKKQIWTIIKKNTLILMTLLPIIINMQYQISIFTSAYSLFYGAIVTILYPLFLLTIWFEWTNPVWEQIFSGVENSLLWIKSVDVVVLFGHWKETTITIYYGVGICLFWLNKKWRWKMFLILLWMGNLTLLTINNWQQRNYQLHLINVGHGLAMLLQGPNKETNILFDAGIGKMKNNDSNLINRYLKKVSVQSLDAVFISHQHSDHYNNLRFLSKAIQIKKTIFNQHQKAIYQIKELTFSNWAFSYYQEMEAENNRGLVLYSQINNHKLLFTFDLEHEGELQLLKQQQLPAIDLLQVGHHGAGNASSSIFLQQLKPQYCLISSANQKPPALKNLKAVNCQVFNTKKQNNIIVTLGKKITVRWN